MQYTNRTSKQPMVPAPAKKRNKEKSDRQSATAEATAKVACGLESKVKVNHYGHKKILNERIALPSLLATICYNDRSFFSIFSFFSAITEKRFCLPTQLFSAPLKSVLFFGSALFSESQIQLIKIVIISSMDTVKPEKDPFSPLFSVK